MGELNLYLINGVNIILVTTIAVTIAVDVRCLCYILFDRMWNLPTTSPLQKQVMLHTTLLKIDMPTSLAVSLLQCLYHLLNIKIIFLDDHSRVILSEVPGITGSDFINASYIDVS